MVGSRVEGMWPRMGTAWWQPQTLPSTSPEALSSLSESWREVWASWGNPWVLSRAVCYSISLPPPWRVQPGATVLGLLGGRLSAERGDQP